MNDASDSFHVTDDVSRKTEVQTRNHTAVKQVKSAQSRTSGDCKKIKKEEREE